MEEMIVFVDEDGKEIEMFVIEETRINNVNYILVTDSDGEDEEAEAYILKDVSEESDKEAAYIMVEDDTEREAVSAIFSELLENIELETE